MSHIPIYPTKNPKFCTYIFLLRSRKSMNSNLFNDKSSMVMSPRIADYGSYLSFISAYSRKELLCKVMHAFIPDICRGRL